MKPDSTLAELPVAAPTKLVASIVAKQGCYHGNVTTDVQFSWIIRPVDETSCNGFDFNAGELRRADLKPFGDYPFAVAMANQVPHRKTVLFVWRRHRKHEGAVIYGATLTDMKGNILDRRVRGYTRFGRATVRYLEHAAGLKIAASPASGQAGPH